MRILQKIFWKNDISHNFDHQISKSTTYTTTKRFQKEICYSKGSRPGSSFQLESGTAKRGPGLSHGQISVASIMCHNV